MALTICPECRKDVSTEATKCPHCGYEMVKKASSGCATIFAFIILGVVVLITIIYIFSSFSSTDSNKDTSSSPTPSRSECLQKLLETEKLMMNVKHDHMEWYIDPKVWLGFTLEEKKHLVNSLSACRKAVHGYRLVEIKDGYSGSKLAETGLSGPKIYK